MNTTLSKSNSCIIGTLLITFASLLLSGCAPLTYRTDFNDYGDVYADTQNHQMLLNLARLAQHAPPYFFQSGNIQQNYTFTGNISASGGQTTGGPHPYSWLVNALSAQATRTSQPTFNFIPLVGGPFAQHLITPIRPDMFDAFFQANYPVDILMRALVQQVQFTVGNSTNSPLILNNIPSDENITNYVRFLRLCDMLRDLQDRGNLLLVSRQAGSNALERIDFTNGLKITDPQMVLNTTTQGYRWSPINGGWHVERDLWASNTLQFQITENGITYLQDKLKHGTNQPPPYNHPDQVANLISVLNPASQISAQVTLRSFLFTLQDMATEQEAFNLLARNREFTTNSVPARQFRPLLQIAWSDEPGPLFDPVASLNYRNTRYEITDPVQPRYESNGYNSYNRDAFLLACTLFSQISLDPTTLNYQQQYLLTR